jgi:hypothetical protein
VKTPKQAVIGVIEREWHAFQGRLEAASPAAFDLPVFTDEGTDWRLRDLLAHIAFLQDLAAQAAERMTREHIRPGPEERLRTFMGETREVNELNDAAVSASRGRPIDDVRSGLLRAHARLVDAIRGCPDELLLTGSGPENLVRVLHVPAVLHLRTHAPHVDAALQKEGATIK